MLRVAVFSLLLLGSLLSASAQQINRIINAKQVERIERILSADDMQGRKPFTPGIDKAAEFISDEFKKAGIQPVNGSFFQEFTVPITKSVITGRIDGNPVNDSNVAIITGADTLSVSDESVFERIVVSKADTLQIIMRSAQTQPKNYLLLLDSSLAGIFNAYKQSRRINPAMKNAVVMILGLPEPGNFNLDLKKQTTQMPLKNVVGMIPGKSKKEEYVIFSGHYDHLGIGKPDANGDSIYNGANDDAAGITAVIMLANYFAKKKDNERTIIFAAFTAEESGGFGSRHFSQQYDPAKVVAMFNIEMIGTESKWGKNSAFITGYEKTDMGKILEKNLQGSAFKFYPDPYPAQDLFYRSDNATLARQGVAAHTISTSKMDSEKFYHTQDDEISTLDMKNMAEIIKAIAISSTGIIAGRETPTRVDASKLK
jgi:hypothetical protein